MYCVMMHIVVEMVPYGVDSDVVVVKDSPLSAIKWEEWFWYRGIGWNLYLTYSSRTT